MHSSSKVLLAASLAALLGCGFAVRYSTNAGVDYGSDPASGIFIDIDFGNDRYFDLHTGIPLPFHLLISHPHILSHITGPAGLGQHVEPLTMAAYMQRLNVPHQHIVELLGSAVAEKLAALSPAERVALAGGTGPITAPNMDVNNPADFDQMMGHVFAKHG